MPLHSTKNLWLRFLERKKYLNRPCLLLTRMHVVVMSRGHNPVISPKILSFIFGCVCGFRVIWFCNLWGGGGGVGLPRLSKGWKGPCIAELHTNTTIVNSVYAHTPAYKQECTHIRIQASSSNLTYQSNTAF